MIKILQSTYICSICPIPLKALNLPYGIDDHPKGGRNTQFKLPPVNRGDKPFVLEVSDMFENIPDPVNQTPAGACTQAPRIVTCDAIARDLVSQWTNFMHYHGKYGIGIIAGPEPTAEELADLTTQQMQCFEEVFHEAELLATKNEVNKIKTPHRIVGEYLARKRSWWSNDQGANISQCPACFGDVDSRASVCRHCGRQIRELPPDIAALNESRKFEPKPVAPRAPEPEVDLSAYSSNPEPVFDTEPELVAAGAPKAPAKPMPGKPVPSIPIPQSR